MTRPRVPVLTPVFRGGRVSVDKLPCAVTREAIVLALPRGGKVRRESTRGRSVPLGLRAGGVALTYGLTMSALVVFTIVVFDTAINVAVAVVDLTGALTRVRAGAVRLRIVLSATVPVACVVDVHLPPAQVGVVLAGAVRAGTEVVACSGAREPMLL